MCLMHYMCCVYCCFIFFFKQKTAYEMRISDWSSDVCSSDLQVHARQFAGQPLAALVALAAVRPLVEHVLVGSIGLHGIALQQRHEIGRASCRERVCSTCRSRWSPYH